MTGPAVLLRVPLPDHAAERHLAGCAAASRKAARLAVVRCSFEHFADGRCWEVIVRGTHELAEDPEIRIEKIAEFIEMEPAELRSWVDWRPVQIDKGGALARQVVAAAGRRREVLDLVGRLEVLGAELVQEVRQ